MDGHALCRGAAALLAACLGLPSASAFAYTAAGDRMFPATILLPQIAPSDDLYLTPSTQPLHSATLPGSNDRLTNFSATYDKTITDRLSIGIGEGWNQLDQAGAGTAYGWQSLETMVQYLAILNAPHEFLLSVGVDREWGGTGAFGIGASQSGDTTPTVYFGKGFGDLPIDYLRPFSISGTVGYQLSDTSAQPDQMQTGVAIAYSIPYLESKVAALALPDYVRALTPMVEIFFTTPSSNPRGTTTGGTVAPGFNYAGEGWEIGVEALIPATRSAGSGIGFTAQLHLSLDYLFPDSIGRPLLGAR